MTDRRRPEVRVLSATKIVSDTNLRPAPRYRRRPNDRKYYNPGGRDPVQHSSDRLAGSAPVNHRDARREDAGLRGASDLPGAGRRNGPEPAHRAFQDDELLPLVPRDGGLRQEPARG